MKRINMRQRFRHPQQEPRCSLGRHTRSPKIYHESYLVLSELSKHIQEAVAELTGNSLRILDVGCGVKPYLPFFKYKAASYIGVDTSLAPNVDIICVAEQLPFTDESSDVVICTQVLEHVNDPQKVLKEMHRVLKREGTLILSTHGIWRKHNPQDCWRWTDMGLKKILAPFREVEVKNCGGAILCFFQILNLYISWLPIGKSPLHLISNVLGKYLDKIYHNGSLVINYLVVAKK